MEFLEELEKEMRAHNVFVSEKINLSKKKQRLRRANHTSGKDIFVFIHGNFEGASYGDWRDEDTWKTWWLNDWNKLTPSEKYERKKLIEVYKTEQLIEKLDSLKEAKKIWGKTIEADNDHAYLSKKQLWRAPYAKQFEDRLVIPIYDRFADLQAIQYIYPTGYKHPEPGTSYKHGHLLLGEELTEITYICEGWATGVSIYEATGNSVIVTFTASNILAIADLFKSRFPEIHYHICADNDSYGLKNVGFELAEEAAKFTGSTLLIPRFDHLKFEGKLTDFNDLMCIAGIEEVEKQLRKMS